MPMDHVLAGDVSGEAPAATAPPSSTPAPRRIFESDEVGLFHLTLTEGQRVPVGHEELTILVLCLAGEIALANGQREVTLASNCYATLSEGETGEITSRDGGAEALLFLGLEQLPGAFFNSYGSANV